MTGWGICPFLNRWDWTQQALEDALNQTIHPHVLAIAIGVDDDTRHALERWCERELRLHAWYWEPGLPSLSATWNTALNFVWDVTHGDPVTTDALVINNDVRLRPEVYERLRFYVSQGAWFVSAVGRREHDIAAISEETWQRVLHDLTDPYPPIGGPDFSCYLITQQAHAKYPFDEGFSPAYCEDCDAHRRYLLGGDGDKIFSVNFPYLHYGAGTLNADPEKAAVWAKRIANSRAHYERKWGGPVNQERFTIPFMVESTQDGVTTPELQSHYVGRLPDVVELTETLGDA